MLRSLILFRIDAGDARQVGKVTPQMVKAHQRNLFRHADLSLFQCPQGKEGNLISE